MFHFIYIDMQKWPGQLNKLLDGILMYYLFAVTLIFDELLFSYYYFG